MAEGDQKSCYSGEERRRIEKIPSLYREILVESGIESELLAKVGAFQQI